MNGIAILLTVLVTGDSGQITTLEQGQVPQISQQQVEYYPVFDDGGLVVVTLIGVVLLRLVLRHRRIRAADERNSG
ncbi:MAG TPA: hypothetical protein VGP36_12190 [Mycobacteriales bacterium]|jgi:hypothetical protein|nr:hypothetical protein [Mycobacteriales bacterium]